MARDMSSYMSAPSRSPAGSGMMGGTPGAAPAPRNMSPYMGTGSGTTADQAAKWHAAQLPKPQNNDRYWRKRKARQKTRREAAASSTPSYSAQRTTALQEQRGK